MWPVLVASVAAVVAVTACGGPDEAEKQAAIAAARVAYEQARAEGRDLSQRPCIADPLPAPSDDWVADVAHDPRTDLDDDPANQCASYRDGEAKHFVELDPDGNPLRAE
jgi:type II secretory pathway pseudopilin PulG